MIWRGAIWNAHAPTNLVHVEMFFDPQGHTARGVAFSTVINGLHRAIMDAGPTLGIRASLIMCFFTPSRRGRRGEDLG